MSCIILYKLTGAYMPKKIKLLRISQAAQMLGVNPETLRRWDNKGVLKAVRIGGRGDRRYKTDDIEKMVNKRKIG